MASFYRSKNKRFVCDVYGYGRIRLGSVKADASIAYVMIERLENSRKRGQPIPSSVLEWLEGCDIKLRKRLATIGMIEQSAVRTVGDILDHYAERRNKKTNSDRNRKNAERSFEAFFDRSMALRDMKKPDGIMYLNWLKTKGRNFGKAKGGLAEATAARRFIHARSMLATAVDFEWITKNPFTRIKAGKQTNAHRSFFVDRDITAKIFEEIPTVQLKLAFALGRWGGFRLPSEAIHLKWSDIDWERRSMTFRSIKTERYEGLEFRTCPIFVELQPYLDAAFDAAAPGEDFCIPDVVKRKYPHRYLTDRVEAAIDRASKKSKTKIPRWEKLFNNLRATRATEVDDEFGAKSESEWIGHGAVVALRHYLMQTDDKWARATGQTGAKVVKSSDKHPKTAKVNTEN